MAVLNYQWLRWILLYWAMLLVDSSTYRGVCDTCLCVFVIDPVVWIVNSAMRAAGVYCYVINKYSIWFPKCICYTVLLSWLQHDLVNGYWSPYNHTYFVPQAPPYLALNLVVFWISKLHWTHAAKSWCMNLLLFVKCVIDILFGLILFILDTNVRVAIDVKYQFKLVLSQYKCYFLFGINFVHCWLLRLVAYPLG